MYDPSQRGRGHKDRSLCSTGQALLNREPVNGLHRQGVFEHYYYFPCSAFLILQDRLRPLGLHGVIQYSSLSATLLLPPGVRLERWQGSQSDKKGAFCDDPVLRGVSASTMP